MAVDNAAVDPSPGTDCAQKVVWLSSSSCLIDSEQGEPVGPGASLARSADQRMLIADGASGLVYSTAPRVSAIGLWMETEHNVN